MDLVAYALSASVTAAMLFAIPYFIIRAADYLSDFHSRGMQRLASYDDRASR